MKQGDLVASKYRLITRIGTGGMGEVWSAAHLQTEREFAIKFMHPAIAETSEDARFRFIQEAKASGKINHPNIIDIFDVGETAEGALYLVMELLDGMSFADALRADPVYSARDLLIVVAGTLAALVAAHAVGVIHRDIKPPNIYLHRDRATGAIRTKVVDFGVSKILMGDEGFATHTGSLLGSPRYMSPEQAISATSADGRADLWSIGVVMYEALTGRFPHDGDSSNSIVISIATQKPTPLREIAQSLPPLLVRVIDDCILPVQERVQTASELLERILEILRTHDLRDLPLARPQNWKGRARPRPSSFELDDDVDAIPGVTTTRSVSARNRHSRAELADPSTPVTSSSNNNEDATLIHVPAQIRASASHLVPSVPQQPIVAPSPALIARPSAVIPPPTFGAPPMPMGGASQPFAGSPGVPPLPTNDPTESISSINVVRGDQAFYAEQRMRSDFAALAPKPPRLGLVAAGVGLGLVAVLSLVVIVMKSGAPSTTARPSAQAASSPAALTSQATTSKDSATETPVAASSADAAASADASASAATPSASASTKAATATSQAAAGAAPTASQRPYGHMPKRPSGDALKDLGSGL